MSIPEGDNMIVECAQMSVESDVAVKWGRPRTRNLGALISGGQSLVLRVHSVCNVADNCRSESEVEAMKKLECRIT